MTSTVPEQKELIVFYVQSLPLYTAVPLPSAEMHCKVQSFPPGRNFASISQLDSNVTCPAWGIGMETATQLDKRRAAQTYTPSPFFLPFSLGYIYLVASLQIYNNLKNSFLIFSCDCYSALHSNVHRPDNEHSYTHTHTCTLWIKSGTPHHLGTTPPGYAGHFFLGECYRALPPPCAAQESSH